MKLDVLIRYWNTLTHLRPQQITGQLWMRTGHLIRRFVHAKRRQTKPYPGTHTSAGPWYPPPSHHARDNSARLLLQGKFRFINETHTLNWPPDWSASQQGKLWQYNLHYFEWLWQLPKQTAMDVVQDWIQYSEKHPYHTGWDPYPTSLRVLNWCGVFTHSEETPFEQLPKAFRDVFWDSLCRQMEWLILHLEYHLMGNHLFENAVTLVLVGSHFKGANAQRWLSIGLPLLEREVQEQILRDGLHYERSPMYHLRMVYLMLLLLHQGEDRSAALARRHLPRMLRAMMDTCHPDGDIALFNDSALGIYHTPTQLLYWARESQLDLHNLPWKPIGSWSLPDAGYYGARTTSDHYIMCDAGRIAPDYIPGHAHADIFSFELSLHGHRVIVDSGVFDYIDSPKRAYCRSTRAHNTVEVDEVDQCELWGAFRVAQRGTPQALHWSHTDTTFQLDAVHDGYTKTTSKSVQHQRTFQWDSSQSILLRVHDALHTEHSIRAVSRIHLHPSCSVLGQEENSVRIAYPKGQCMIHFVGPGTLHTHEQSWYCPAFGTSEANSVLTFITEGSQLQFGYTIEVLSTPLDSEVL